MPFDYFVNLNYDGRSRQAAKYDNDNDTQAFTLHIYFSNFDEIQIERV